MKIIVIFAVGKIKEKEALQVIPTGNVLETNQSDRSNLKIYQVLHMRPLFVAISFITRNGSRMVVKVFRMVEFHGRMGPGNYT